MLQSTGRFGFLLRTMRAQPASGCAALGLTCVLGSLSAVAGELLLERHIDDRYHVLVQLSGDEMRRNVYPKFEVAIELTGSDGRTYTLRQPFELYSETRRYLPDAALADAYEIAYAELVANGECQPVYAGYHQATFDCGERQGMRTVAVRTDLIGAHVSSEMIASSLIPDEAEFANARGVLDALTSELESHPAATRPVAADERR